MSRSRCEAVNSLRIDRAFTGFSILAMARIVYATKTGIRKRFDATASASRWDQCRSRCLIGFRRIATICSSVNLLFFMGSL